MREAGKATAEILDAVGEMIMPGVSTGEINELVHRLTLEKGGRPAPLHYKGFPKSCCVSVNEVVCHGIPGQYNMLNAGDIVNVDVTTVKNGYYGDSSRMYLIGGENACTLEALDLVRITKEALRVGMEEVKPGNRIGDIGAAIQEFIRSTKKGYGIVRDYTGHGIGKNFHEPPQIVHIGKRGSGEKMQAGMTFTIEPMINEGTYRTVLSKVDGWTVRTADNKLSAQWEHTVLVTDNGYEILTVS